MSNAKQKGLINMTKKKKHMKVLIISLGVILGGLLICFFVLPLFSITIIGLPFITAKPKVTTDIRKYEEYIGKNANEKYAYKHGIDESIFPETITDDMNPIEYQMVYYNPWEEQYLSYLTIEYSEDKYQNELARLSGKRMDDYRGIYCVEDEPENYDLLAIEADDYAGFVYALIPENENNTVTYVEIIFAPYFLDLEADDYIPNEYLLKGFDASEDNEYRKEQTKNSSY